MWLANGIRGSWVFPQRSNLVILMDVIWGWSRTSKASGHLAIILLQALHLRPPLQFMDEPYLPLWQQNPGEGNAYRTASLQVSYSTESYSCMETFNSWSISSALSYCTSLSIPVALSYSVLFLPSCSHFSLLSSLSKCLTPILHLFISFWTWSPCYFLFPLNPITSPWDIFPISFCFPVLLWVVSTFLIRFHLFPLLPLPLKGSHCCCWQLRKSMIPFVLPSVSFCSSLE